MNATSPERGLNNRRCRLGAGLLAGLLAPALLSADAGTGELGGYRLGDRYPLNADTRWQPAADGSVKITAQAPDKPPDIDAVYLYATPGEYRIGKIVLYRRLADLAAAQALAADYQQRLEARYGGWERMSAPIPMPRTGGEMLSRLKQGPYALIVYYRGAAPGAEMAVELEYDSGAPQRKAWKGQLRAGQATQ
jgi:hypothetical protein